MPILSDGLEINKTYQVERLLGEGAFAEVYRVKHRFLGRQAMKVFHPGLTTKAIEKQLGEAVLLSQVGHPNIVRVFDANIVQIKKGTSGILRWSILRAEAWINSGVHFAINLCRLRQPSI